ncbi:MAG: YciI family protein [Candidatus Sulfotelmatobacter sp.]
MLDIPLKTQKCRSKMKGAGMKYILMMNTMKAGHGVPGWAQNDLRAHVAYMIALNKDLRESGEFVAAEGLSFPDQAKLVRAGKDGVPITDGIFPESKEFLAGYWIVDVESADQAYAIAARASAAPGPGGEPLNMPIEVRPVMSGPPPEML